MNRNVILAAGALAALLIAGTGSFLFFKEAPAGTAKNMPALEPAAHEEIVAGADIGGPFTLTDHNGQTVSDKTYAGQYKLMFFGFTYCPDICPTELKKISLVLEQLGKDVDKIKPLFVSIDPERDTPDVLKTYLQSFDSRITGLTGTVEQIEHMEKIYRVYASKVEDPRFTEYLVNHSSMIYLMSPDDTLLALFRAEDTPAQIVKKIARYVNNG